MKKTVAVLLCAVLTLLLAACADKPEKVFEGSGTSSEESKKAENLSDFVAVDFSGNSVTGDIFGKCRVTMINMWATYCGPCINEMPALGKLSDSFGDGFQIIGIPCDIVDRNMNILPEQKSKAEEIIGETKAGYTHLVPSKTLQNILLYKIFSVPTTVFVNSSGDVLGEYYIGARDEDDWKSIIEQLMEEES